MAREIRRLQPGESPRFVGSTIEIHKSGVEQPTNGNERVGGDNTGRVIRAAAGLGAWEIVSDMALAYPRSVLGAVKYRIFRQVGIAPPPSGYSEQLKKDERQLLAKDAENSLGWNVPKKKSADEKRREHRRRMAIQDKEIAAIRERMENEARVASQYSNRIKNTINVARAEENDPSMMEKLAFEVMGSAAQVAVVNAFHAGQSVSETKKDPTPEELTVASQCLEAEAVSGRVWTNEERKSWTMATLSRNALEIIINGGVLAREVQEHDSLQQLNLRSSESGANALTEYTLLEIPAVDIAIAQGLGAPRADERMFFNGVKVVMGVNNKIYVRYAAQRDQIAAGMNDFEVDAGLVPDAGLLNSVRNGDLGNEKFRNFINWILGESNRELPLPGALALGSTTQEEDKNKAIPMMNPILGEEILTQVARAINDLEERVTKIKEINDLVTLPKPVVVQEITARTLNGIRKLPNADKVVSVAEESHAQMSKARSTSVDVYLGVQIDRGRALDIFTRNKFISSTLSKTYPEHGSEMMSILEERAVPVLLPDKDAAEKYMRTDRQTIMEALRRDYPNVTVPTGPNNTNRIVAPGEWKQILGMLDDRARRLLKS